MCIGETGGTYVLVGGSLPVSVVKVRVGVPKHCLNTLFTDAIGAYLGYAVVDSLALRESGRPARSPAALSGRAQACVELRVCCVGGA